MKNKIYVKPVEGMIINMPERNNMVLPEDGMYVPKVQFWFRRLRDGDVVEMKSPSKKKQTSSDNTDK